MALYFYLLYVMPVSSIDCILFLHYVSPVVLARLKLLLLRLHPIRQESGAGTVEAKEICTSSKYLIGTWYGNRGVESDNSGK